MGDDKDLTMWHPDEQLAADLKSGKVTQQEVDRIWAATWDLSAQAPITVRRAVAAMREATKGKDNLTAMADAWPMFCQQVMQATTEMQAALMRDESKFAHLVAHTEDVVRELRKVGPLSTELIALKAQNEHLAAQLEHIQMLLTRPRWWQFWKRRKIPADDMTMDDRVDEAIAQEPYNARIGSVFDKS